MDSKLNIQRYDDGSATQKSHSSSPNPTSQVSISNPHKTPVVVIAGATVGGVVGLALISLLLYFFCIRRRREYLEPASQNASGRAGNSSPSWMNQDQSLFASGMHIVYLCMRSYSFYPRFEIKCRCISRNIKSKHRGNHNIFHTIAHLLPSTTPPISTERFRAIGIWYDCRLLRAR